MIQAIIFDVDDTLYDQQKLWLTAFLESFTIKDVPADTNPWYHCFRYYSDYFFEKHTAGKCSIEEMRIARIRETMKHLFQQKISDSQALHFQNLYTLYAKQINLHPEAKKTLEFLQKQGLPLGVITNGLSQHQRSKVKQLNIPDYIPEKFILVSRDIEIDKPDPRIFTTLATRLKMAPEYLLYIGDSFENDVIGAKTAGWQVLWHNHRKKTSPTDSSYQPDWEIHSFEELLPTIQHILKETPNN